MPPFLTHFLELLAAHVLAGLVLAGAGFALSVWLWEPAKRYWKARSWLNRAVAVGVRNFFPSRESYAVDRPLAFVDYLSSAGHDLSYFGHWLAFSIEQHDTLNTLCTRAAAGVKVKLVLLDPELPQDILETYAAYLNESAASLRAQITSTWTRVHEARASLGTAHQRNLDLRRHREFIPFSAFWFDRSREGEHILIDVKIFGMPRRDAFGIELHPAAQASSRHPSLFHRFATSLDKLNESSNEY